MKKKEKVQDVVKASGVCVQSQNFFGIYLIRLNNLDLHSLPNLGVLAEHGELRMFPSIVKHFEEIMKTHHNEVQVHVASAEVCQPFGLIKKFNS